ncbi:MAG: phosphoribosyltransferase family protein [Burkholderiaceae bacterium]
MYWRRPNAVLIGPTKSRFSGAAQAANRHGWDHAVCRKTRSGDRAVSIELPALPVRGRQVVLMDDVASSGHTLAQAARLLLAAGAVSVDVAVTCVVCAGRTPAGERSWRGRGLEHRLHHPQQQRREHGAGLGRGPQWPVFNGARPDTSLRRRLSSAPTKPQAHQHQGARHRNQ